MMRRTMCSTRPGRSAAPGPQTPQNQFLQWTLDHWTAKFLDDSLWKRLTRAQCQAVEAWFFDDYLTSTQIAEHIQARFGVKTSHSSVGRLHKHLARLRQAYDLFEAQLSAQGLNAMPGNTADMRDLAVKLLAKSAVTLGTCQPGQVRQLLPIAKFLLESEENEIRLRRVKLEERSFDYQCGSAGRQAVEKVRAYLNNLEKNDYLEEEEKRDCVRAVRQRLFGPDPVPLQSPDPNCEPAPKQEVQAALENTSAASGDDPALPGQETALRGIWYAKPAPLSRFKWDASRLIRDIPPFGKKQGYVMEGITKPSRPCAESRFFPLSAFGRPSRMRDAQAIVSF